jgi:hypothetical protein
MSKTKGRKSRHQGEGFLKSCQSPPFEHLLMTIKTDFNLFFIFFSYCIKQCNQNKAMIDIMND